MAYAAEIRVINEKNERNIQATQMEYQSRRCELTRGDLITNKGIRRRQEMEISITGCWKKKDWRGMIMSGEPKKGEITK